MEAELKRKSTRTVHGEKVVRLRLDIPYEEIEEAEEEGQDMLKWLDRGVDSEVKFNIGPFEDEEQVGLSELESKADEIRDTDVGELTDIEDM